MGQPDADELSTPFAMPNATLRGGERLADGAIQMPWYEYDEAGERLISFARHGAFDGMTDRERAQQEALVASLRSGEADDPVSGETEMLWRCLFAVVRSERFTEGVVAANALALTRIANELRRRILTKT